MHLCARKVSPFHNSASTAKYVCFTHGCSMPTSPPSSSWPRPHPHTPAQNHHFSRCELFRDNALQRTPSAVRTVRLAPAVRGLGFGEATEKTKKRRLPSRVKWPRARRPSVTFHFRYDFAIAPAICADRSSAYRSPPPTQSILNFHVQSSLSCRGFVGPPGLLACCLLLSLSQQCSRIHAQTHPDVALQDGISLPVPRPLSRSATQRIKQRLF